MAFDHSCRPVGGAVGLLYAVEGTYVLHKVRPQPLVPAHPINIDGVTLCRVDAHVEGNVLTLVDAGGRGIALDLAHSVRPYGRKRNPPLARTGLLVFDNDRIAGLPVSRSHYQDRCPD